MCILGWREARRGIRLEVYSRSREGSGRIVRKYTALLHRILILWRHRLVALLTIFLSPRSILDIRRLLLNSSEYNQNHASHLADLSSPLAASDASTSSSTTCTKPWGSDIWRGDVRFCGRVTNLVPFIDEAEDDDGQAGDAKWVES